MSLALGVLLWPSSSSQGSPQAADDRFKLATRTRTVSGEVAEDKSDSEDKEGGTEDGFHFAKLISSASH